MQHKYDMNEQPGANVYIEPGKEVARARLKRDVCDAVSALVLRGWQNGHADEITQLIVTAMFAGQIPHVKVMRTRTKDRRIVRDRLLEFYSEDEVRDWYFSPHPQLNGKSAATVVLNGGEEQVHEIIDRLESGGYL